VNSKSTPHFKSGDVVEIKSLDEIRTTLDADGAYENVPFMEEMQRFCGRRFRVFKRADKVCIEREGFLDFGRMQDAVLLEEIRCDGSAHDGCQKLCLIFWKEAWLKPAPPHAAPEPPIDWVTEALPASTAEVDESKTYSCQSTALLKSTERLPVWDPRQYLRDLESRALGPVDLAKAMLIEAYNVVSRRRGGREFGAVFGKAKKTPLVQLGLKRADVVKIKPRSEITETLDTMGRNRGLFFAYDMARHCNGTRSVITPVNRMILETTGKMKKVSNTVLLQGASCTGLCNRGCARNSHPLWREAWLEPADGRPSGATPP
jgi:hypothetical protein